MQTIHIPKNDCSGITQYTSSCTVELQQLERQSCMLLNRSSYTLNATGVQYCRNKWTTTEATDCIHTLTHTPELAGRTLFLCKSLQASVKYNVWEAGNTAVTLLTWCPSISLSIVLFPSKHSMFKLVTLLRQNVESVRDQLRIWSLQLQCFVFSSCVNW